MGGFLFNRIVFGPVQSRRLGMSLGMNLLPKGYKYCSFDCVYCECGWTLSKTMQTDHIPKVEEVKNQLTSALKLMVKGGRKVDAITFAGNGEPTLHPDFEAIVDDTLQLRDEYMPEAKVSVLSNATTLQVPGVMRALGKVDQALLKLDAGTQEVFESINQCLDRLQLVDIVENIRQLKSKIIIQSLFVHGWVRGIKVDNTTESEIMAWLQHIKAIQPSLVMIYPVHRNTPGEELKVVSTITLNDIAAKVELLGIPAKVY